MPKEKVAKMLRSHKQLILNWFKAQGRLSLTIVEDFNFKTKLTMRKAYGIKSVEYLQIALYQTLVDLQEPKVPTHFAEKPKKVSFTAVDLLRPFM